MDTERVVQLGMMADAAAESIVVTRLLDTEGCPTETIARRLEVFLQSIHILFLDSGCTRTGYTHHAL